MNIWKPEKRYNLSPSQINEIIKEGKFDEEEYAGYALLSYIDYDDLTYNISQKEEIENEKIYNNLKPKDILNIIDNTSVGYYSEEYQTIVEELIDDFLYEMEKYYKEKRKEIKDDTRKN